MSYISFSKLLPYKYLNYMITFDFIQLCQFLFNCT